MNYYYNMVSPAYDCIPFVPLFILQFCDLYSTCTIKILPPFIPNDYLYKKHADKGEEKWEIYAWAVKDAMCKAGNFKNSN